MRPSSFTSFRGPRRAGGTPPYLQVLPTPAPPYRYDPFRLVLMAEDRLAPSTSGLPPARLPQVRVASMERRPGPAALRRPHRAGRPAAVARASGILADEILAGGPALKAWPGGAARGARAAFESCLVVADQAAAERVAAELARHRRIARARGPGAAPPLAIPGAGPADSGAGPADSGAGPAAGDVVIMPGARTAPVAQRCETRLVIGPPSGAVIVVPGTAVNRDGDHVLTPETFGRLRRAEDLARRGAVRAVILSGWNGPAACGLTEAEQMLRAWSGPDVPLICDEAARTTAENALCAAAIIGALGEVREVVVVASWANAPRLRLAFRAALRPHGGRARLSTVWGSGHGASWRPGLTGLFRLRQHLRAGQAMLRDDAGLAPVAR
jgi:uncharacterized SAM-binding protein YcdF (DUF218 family)